MKRIVYIITLMISVSSIVAGDTKQLVTILNKIDAWDKNPNAAVTKDMVATTRSDLKTASKEFNKIIDKANDQLDALEKRIKKGVPGAPAVSGDAQTILRRIEDLSDTIQDIYLDADARIKPETYDSILQEIKSLEKAYSSIDKRLQNKKYPGMLETAKDQMKELSKRKEKDVDLKDQLEFPTKIKSLNAKVNKWFINKTTIVKTPELDAAKDELKALQKAYDKLDKKVKDKRDEAILSTIEQQLKEVSRRAEQQGQKTTLVALHKRIDAQSKKIADLAKKTTPMDKKALETMSDELKALDKEYSKIDKELRDKAYSAKLETAQKQLKEVEKRSKK